MSGLLNGAASVRFTTVGTIVARVLCVTFACAMLFAGPAAAQVAPLLNGDFEAAPQSSPWTTVSSGGYLSGATGWRVAAGNVNVGTAPAGTQCQSAGGHCVDLNGSTPGRIEQTMASTAGWACTVTFQMSRHIQVTSATLNTFVNNVATSPGSFTHNTAGISPTDGKWAQHSFSFTSAAPSTTLAFASAIQGAAGPQVDNVTMRCVPPTSSLSVKKIVVNNVGPSAPIPSSFDTTTHCSASAASPGVNTPVAVAGGQSVTQPGSLAAGTICSVTEVLPQNITALEACKGRGATWTETHSGPVTIVAGQAAVLTVTNTLDCDKPKGTLQVHKTVINTLGVPTPPSFNMTASCSGLPQQLVSVAVNGTVTVPPAGLIPDGTVCTISETIPPQVTGVKACPSGTATWVPSNPGPLTIHTAQTTGTIITNTLTCDRPPPGGHLTVNKVVVNLTGGPAPIPSTFPVAAQCTLSGVNTLNVTLPVPSGSGVSAVPVIATGSICSISEGSFPKIPNLKACNGANASWTSSYSSPVTMGAGGASLTATNTLTCDKLQEPVRFEIRKNTGAALIPGTYTFNVTCTGPGGPYTGPNLVTIMLPGSGSATVTVPFGDTCTVTEASLPAPWVAPAFTGSGGLTVTAAGGWAASVGPVTAMGGVLLVANRQVIEKAAFTIRKNTGATVIPGTYVFNLSCTVGGAPVSVTSPVSIMLPGTGFTTIGVPNGATCVVTEQSPGANWNLSPVFTGSSGLTVIPGGGLVATVGPVTGTSGVVTVMNERKPDGCPDRTQTTIGCRVTVLMNRAKGPATYSVIPSQAATYPMSNTLPSTGAACVIPANAMINSTACWFNYSANSTTITLSTASSSGAPPLANWSGDCNAVNSATCTVPAITLATPRTVSVTIH